MKKILAVFIILLIGIYGGGCMNSYRSLEDNRAKSKALDYLKEKYGEEFEVDDVTGSNVAISYNEIYVHPKNNPELVFSVLEEKDTFCDSYYGVFVKDDYDAMMRDIIAEYVDSAKVYSKFLSEYFDDRFKPGMTLDEALAIGKNNFFTNTCIFVRDDVESAVWEQLCSKLESDGFTLYIAIYKVSEDDWDTLSDESYAKYVSDNYRMEPIYKKVIK